MLIEIFSDVVCPWCYIGKRRLDAVLAGWPDHGIEIRWRAFQLYPMLPLDGVPRDEFMRARFGAGAEVGRIYTRILEEAAPLGLELEFERIRRAPNTLRAHRLLAWAGEQSGAADADAEAGGAQHRLAEALFRAYFTAGRDLCDPEVLADAAAAAGFERKEAVEAIARGAGAAAVEADLRAGEEAEITGVPLYVLGGKFAIPGAQPTDVLRKFIERARAKLA
jgi:predicted DsbA family dithiol-disulfide isomerase